ncbi:MAG: aspartate kinase [Kiritimatiellae bacterium]|nr:aspartate kinase [Kiritimatiellia bacterium]
MKVCKFGGSSVADAAQILKILDIVRSDAARRIVVVSAPGQRNKGDDKVTDLLIACAADVLAGRDPAGNVARVVARYESIRADLDLPHALVEGTEAELRRRLAAPREHEGAFLDAVKALGEEQSARFCASAFTAHGLPSVYVDPRDAGMLLSEEFGSARLLPESYSRIKAKLSTIPEIVVFPGFYGYTRSGRIATFSRGGSDITGAILAAALEADVYENFTDVDAVYPVDPRLCPEAVGGEGIAEMTYAEMRELSYAGFAVFHEEAVLPAIRAKIPINIRNTNHPEQPGTMVLPSRKSVPGRVNGIASTAGFGALFVEKWLMNREIGYVAKLLDILAREGVSIECMPAGVDSVTVVFRDEQFPDSVRERVFARIDAELSPDHVSYSRGIAFLVAVGEGMRTTVGTCLRVVSALSRAGINLQMINQGSSELSIMCGIRDDDLKAAGQALYAEFFKERH